MKKILVSPVVTLFFLLLTTAILAQQTDNGSLRGKVVDANGAIVPGATVTVKNANRGITRTITASESGEWTAAVLPLGNYEVKVEMQGFQPSIQTVAVAASV